MSKQGRAPTHILTGLIGASVLAFLAACGGPVAVRPVQQVGPEWLGMCVDSQTGMRVADVECGGDSGVGLALASFYTWDIIDSYRYPDYRFPAYNQRVDITHITVVHTAPKGASVSRDVPSTGGSASSVRTSLSKSSPGVKKPTGGTAPKKSSPTVQRGGLGVTSGGTGGNRPATGSSSHVSGGS